MSEFGSVTVQKCPGSFELIAVVYDFVHEALGSDEVSVDSEMGAAEQLPILNHFAQ